MAISELGPHCIYSQQNYNHCYQARPRTRVATSPVILVRHRGEVTERRLARSSRIPYRPSLGRRRSSFDYFALCFLFLYLISLTSGLNTRPEYGRSTDELTTRSGSSLGSSMAQDRISETIECKIILFDNLYREKDGKFSTKEHLACVPVMNGTLSDMEYQIELPGTMEADHREDIRNGNLYVIISDARRGQDRLMWSPTSQFETKFREHRRMTSTETVGVRTVAVIKINTFDASLDVSVDKMNSMLFDSKTVNFVSQYSACSFGQLTWKPVEGVVEVNLDTSIRAFNSPSAIVQAAQAQLLLDRPDLGSVSKLADSVMFCIPPGLPSGDFIANAGVNYWRSNFYGEWCLSLTATMHELGHNLGLLHANEISELYGDLTGYMGAGYKDAHWPRKCFNAYNQWQLGWYDKRALHIDPSVDGPKLIRLAAFPDYSITSARDYVVVNVANKYFLNFNRAKSFNMETEEKRDMVTVSEPTEGGTNCLIGLRAGEKYQVRTADYQEDMVFEVCNMAYDGISGPDTAVISIGLGLSLCRTSLITPVVVHTSPSPRFEESEESLVPTSHPNRKQRKSSDTVIDEFQVRFIDRAPVMRRSSMPTSVSPTNAPSERATATPTQVSPGPTTYPTLSPSLRPTARPSSQSPSNPPSIIHVTPEPSPVPSQISSSPTFERFFLDSSSPSSSSTPVQLSNRPTPRLGAGTDAWPEVKTSAIFSFDMLFSDTRMQSSMEKSKERPDHSHSPEVNQPPSDSDSLETLVPKEVDDQPPALIIPFEAHAATSSAKRFIGWWTLTCLIVTMA